MKCFHCGKTGHLVMACPERRSYPSVSEQPVVPPAYIVWQAAEGPGTAAATIPELDPENSCSAEPA